MSKKTPGVREKRIELGGHPLATETDGSAFLK